MPGISGAGCWPFGGSGIAPCRFFTECLQLYDNFLSIPSRLKT